RALPARMSRVSRNVRVLGKGRPRAIVPARTVSFLLHRDRPGTYPFLPVPAVPIAPADLARHRDLSSQAQQGPSRPLRLLLSFDQQHPYGLSPPRVRPLRHDPLRGAPPCARVAQGGGTGSGRPEAAPRAWQREARYGHAPLCRQPAATHDRVDADDPAGPVVGNRILLRGSRPAQGHDRANPRRGLGVPTSLAPDDTAPPGRGDR